MNTQLRLGRGFQWRAADLVPGRKFAIGLCIGLAATGSLSVHSQDRGRGGEWRYYQGDAGSTKYSPLDQINRNNVKNLRVVWRRPSVDASLTTAYPDLNPSPNLRATPILINGVLYASNGVGLVEAFEPGTGKTIWVQPPFERGIRGVAGQSTRSIAYWRNGSDERLILTRGEYLEALDLKTGRYIPDFGGRGRVNLHIDDPLAGNYRWTAGPVMVGDVIIVGGNGGGGGDSGVEREAVPEDIRGFDVRTGRLLWTFHVLPRPGEYGHETWGLDSWKTAGDMGPWGPMAVDEALGYVYFATTSPNNSLYGGHRPGQNLFSSSLICLDAKTGKRVWHFQLTHHDLWDMDPLSTMLADINVNGKPIKAVIQTGKLPWIFVFDRVTGQPVWPIEEQPVPKSTVPGEQSWPTQPIPTKPPPFDLVGFTEDDVIDFTPELKAEALKLVKQWVLGPVYTPPSLNTADQPGGTKGTFSVTGPGATSWNGGAFDPETGMFYIVSHSIPFIRGMVPSKPLPPGSKKTILPYADQRHIVGLQVLMPGQPGLPGPQGLPFTKPPYGRITAYDMNKGEKVWQVANGDGPRDHPALKGLNLPPLGIPGRPAPLLTKTLLFLGEGSDAMFAAVGTGKKFRAYDKATGEVLWVTDLPAGTSAGPMTYMWNGKQMIVVPVGDRQNPAEWVALALP
jgi:quinoprotein glucose dehydrogenase